MLKKKSAEAFVRVDQESHGKIIALLKARKRREPRSAIADVIRDLLNNYEAEAK